MGDQLFEIFYVSEFFFLCLYLTDHLTGYQILGWKLFYVRFLTVYLIASSIAREKSKVISDS